MPIALAADRAPTTTTSTSTTTTTTTTTTAPAIVASPAAVVRQVSAVPPPPPPTTTTTTTTTTVPPPPVVQDAVSGEASWCGARTGTCASPFLSFGTEVTVTDVATGGSIRCTVEDRQASSPGRVIDLSYDAFAQLASPAVGLIEVRVSW